MSLTSEQITAKNFKAFYEQIRPYLNGSFPTPVVSKFNKSDLYSTDEQIIGQWIDGKPVYQVVMPASSGVPTLTEDDSRVIYSSQYGTGYAWQAFDGDSNTFWGANTNNARIGWDFEEPVAVHRLLFAQNRTNYPQTSVELGYSDNGTDWTTVHTYTLNVDYSNTTDLNTFDISEDVGEHRYWSIYTTCSSGWTSVKTVNFMTSILPSDINIVIQRDYSSNGTVYQYTKNADSPISIGSDTDYSTTEKVVGTWIDGKPLYQKTFTTDTYWQVSTGGTAIPEINDSIGQIIDHVVSCVALTQGIDGASWQDGTVPMRQFVKISGVYKVVMSENCKMNVITIQYTKTTD